MFGGFKYFLYLCNELENSLRVKAAAQQNPSKLGSAFTLHFTCSVIIKAGKGHPMQLAHLIF